MGDNTKMVELTAIGTWADVDTAMRLIGQLRISIKEIEVDMNRQLADIREKADSSAQPMHEQIKDLETDIRKFVKKHRSELDGKSKALNFGRTGFRASTGLVIPKHVDIIAELRRHGLEDCIKVTEVANRELLKTKPEDDIRKTGAYLKTTDTFFCEINEEKIRPTV